MALWPPMRESSRAEANGRPRTIPARSWGVPAVPGYPQTPHHRFGPLARPKYGSDDSRPIITCRDEGHQMSVSPWAAACCASVPIWFKKQDFFLPPSLHADNSPEPPQCLTNPKSRTRSSSSGATPAPSSKPSADGTPLEQWRPCSTRSLQPNLSKTFAAVTSGCAIGEELCGRTTAGNGLRVAGVMARATGLVFLAVSRPSYPACMADYR